MIYHMHTEMRQSLVRVLYKKTRYYISYTVIKVEQGMIHRWVYSCKVGVTVLPTNSSRLIIGIIVEASEINVFQKLWSFVKLKSLARIITEKNIYYTERKKKRNTKFDTEFQNNN